MSLPTKSQISNPKSQAISKLKCSKFKTHVGAGFQTCPHVDRPEGLSLRCLRAPTLLSLRAKRGNLRLATTSASCSRSPRHSVPRDDNECYHFENLDFEFVQDLALDI